ncbi:MAG TPA: gas vesicle protein GvpG [Longimicrobiales bacterium]|nr:gas vesicle protein GvpG [Longimicrobiales bacterium]
MGLLKHLLFWPVTGPLFLADFSLGRIEGVVREELTDDTRIKAELMELQLMLELGDIDDGEYAELEAELMLQLREIRQWREEFGMGVTGGPVRVQASSAPGDGDPARGASNPDDAAAPAAEGAEEDAGSRVADPRGGADISLNLDWD